MALRTMVKMASCATIQIMKKISPSTLFGKEAAFQLPFFIFLTFILSGIAVWSIIDSPALRAPVRLIPFCVLMLVHIVLYWLAAFMAKNRKWTLGYLVVQGGMALGDQPDRQQPGPDLWACIWGWWEFRSGCWD